MSGTPPARSFAGPPAESWSLRHRVLLGSIVLLALAHLAPYVGYLTDDSFIHFQFAKNLVAGRGFAFNAGEPTYGATSPLWVLLLAGTGIAIPGAASSPDAVASMPVLARVAKAWGALALALSVAALALLGRTLGFPPRYALVLAALLAAHAWSARWAISGMESPLALLLVTAALLALARALLRGTGAFVPGLLLGIATVARPECWLLLGLGIAAIAYGSAARRGARALGALAGAALGAGPWLLAAWIGFHRLLPNTSAAKAGAFLDPELALSALRASIRVLLSTDALALALAVLALALAGPSLVRNLPRERRAFWLLAAAWPLALVLGLAAGGVQIISRYLLPATPAVLVLGVGSLRWASARLGARGRGAALAALLALYAAQNAFLTIRHGAPHAQRHSAGLRGSLASLGLWARFHTPPGTRFALPDIGAFGFYSDRPVLDLFGLVTPRMAPIMTRAGYDAVVLRLLFEPVGRPPYLIDRARVANRLGNTDDPAVPYRFVMARAMPDLGITRPGAHVYSLYEIRWDLYDRMFPRFASGFD